MALDYGYGRPQFVGSILDEPALLRERIFHLIHHVIEHRHQGRDFISVRSGPHPFLHSLVLNVPHRQGHRLQRPEQIAGKQPADHDAEQDCTQHKIKHCFRYRLAKLLVRGQALDNFDRAGKAEYRNRTLHH
ncbi:hypothetical protein D3C84_958760 [compost metagenome]